MTDPLLFEPGLKLLMTSSTFCIELLYHHRHYQDLSILGCVFTGCFDCYRQIQVRSRVTANLYTSIVCIMEAGKSTTAQGSKRFARTQKLKDTCDSCAASKVKCTKEKPACSRCQNLGYPCFYSPAKRMGRPIPSRKTASDAQTGISRDAAATGIDRGNPKSQGQGTKAVPRSGSEISTITSTSSTRPPAPSPWFDLDNFSFPPIPSIDTHTDVSKAVITGSPPNTNDQKCNMTSKNNNHRDCVTVIVELLRHLHETRETRLQRDLCSCHGRGQAHAELLDIASKAIKPVSTVLVCPCSSTLDVGLLCASVCSAILDLYEIILRSCAGSIQNDNTDPMSDGDRTMDSAMSWPAASAKLPQNSTELLDVLQKLPRVADLIILFSRRYSDSDQHSYSTETLLVLATSIRQRVNTMTNQATTWLAEGTMHQT